MFQTINQSSSIVDKTNAPPPSQSPALFVPQPAWTPHILVLKTTITAIDTPLIPFAILKHNPLPDFHNLILQTPLVTFKEAWDAPFSTLTRDRIFFLSAWSAIPNASTRVIQTASFTIGIATPGPLYTRWLTTRSVSRQGEAIAWCIEIDMRQSEEERGVEYCEVVLGEENKLTLA